MKIVEFDQGSQAWLDWRKDILTATDAPALLGKSPYATPYQCWGRKKGVIPEQKQNKAMSKGQMDEPIAREWFNKEYGIEMVPRCIESEEYNFIGASLDGLSPCGKYLLEIKSNGDQYHFGLNGGLPDFHYDQMQHQFLSTDKKVEKGFYLSWNKEGPRVVEVFPDKEWLEDYLPKATEFWKRLIFFDPPPLCNRDYKDMSHNYEWELFAKQYREVSKEIKNLEERKELFKKKLVELCEESSSSGYGIKVLKKIVKGKIEYETMPEIANVDVEKYRKPSTESWTIMMDRN